MVHTGTLPRKRRWSAFLAGCTGLFALLLLWSGAEAIGEHVETDALESAEQRAGAIAEVASQFAQRALAAARDAQALAGHWAAHRAPEEAAIRAEVAKLLAEHIAQSGGAIARIAIADAAGRVIWSSDAQEGSVAGQPWFQAHASTPGPPRVSPTIGAAPADAALPAWTIPVSTRVEAAEGGFGGAAVVALDVSGLEESLAALAHRPGEVAAILRREGDLLVRSADTARLIGRPLVTERTRMALLNGETTPFRSRSPLTGEEVMISFRAVPGGAVLAVGSVTLGPALAHAARIHAGARVAALAAWAVLLLLLLAGFAVLRGRNVRRELAAQQAGRAEIERLLAGLPAIVFLREVGPDGTARHLYRNGDSAAVSGWPPEALPSRQPWADLADPEADFESIYQRALTEGQAVMDWRMRQPDGSWAWMRSTLRLLERLPEGRGLVVGYIVNITAERAAEARALAASRLASLGEMGAGLAHELRQPLTAISLAAGVAVMAAKRGDNDRVLQRLDRILDQVKRGSAIIDYLRRFARGREDEEGVVPVDLAVAVNGALALCGGALAEAGAEVLVTLGPPAPVVLGHAVPIEQVLVNLLFNARDAVAALPPGTPRQIAITAETEDGVARLAVADTGGGILPAVLGRVFEPFVTTKGPDRGAGLGLSICHGLMRSMGGGIVAENAGAGARFTLSLPVAPEGALEKMPEGALDRTPEGALDRAPEGALEKMPEGALDRAPEGAPDKAPDGVPRGTPAGAGG
jgi:signal transduction histidine kinase